MPSDPSIEGSKSDQADFVRELFTAWDDNAQRIRHIEYFSLHDFSPEIVLTLQSYYGISDFGFGAYLAWIIHEATRFFRAPFSCSKSCSVGNTVCIAPGHVGSFTEFATEKGVGERIRRFTNSPG